MFYYFPPHVLPSFLTLQDTFSSLSQSFAFSVSLFPLFSRLFNPFVSIQNPILFSRLPLPRPFLRFYTTYSFSLYFCPCEKFFPIRALFPCISSAEWRSNCHVENGISLFAHKCVFVCLFKSRFNILFIHAFSATIHHLTRGRALQMFFFYSVPPIFLLYL